MDSLLQDLRYGWRVLRGSASTSLLAVLTLALGLGAVTGVFAIVDGVLLESLPYPDADRLVAIWEFNGPRARARNVVNPANFMAWREANRSFDAMVAITRFEQPLTGLDEPEEVTGMLVNYQYFSLLGARPALGRTFTADEDADGAPLVGILSHELWSRRFGADPAALGRTVEVNGRAVTIVGVMPADFRTSWPGDADLWMPAALGERHRNFSGRYMLAMGRLREGVDLEAAQQEMDAIAERLAREYPERDAGWGVNLVPLHEQVAGDVRPALLAVLGAVGLLLLIACANVANLLLARASGREREIAVRAALGAGNRRIARQLLAEGLLLAVAGGLLGLGGAWVAVRLLVRRAPVGLDLPRLYELSLDPRVFVFAGLAMVGTALLFGLAPALHAVRGDLASRLRGRGEGEGPGSARLQASIAVAQIALAVVLLVGAGLLLRSFIALLSVDPGYDPARVLTVRLRPTDDMFGSTEALLAAQNRLLERVSALPGVDAAGTIQFLPVGGLRSATSFFPEDLPEPEPGQYPTTDVRVIDGDYFAAMGVPVLRGRSFDSRDTAAAPKVVIVNRTLAESTWRGENPIGKRLSLHWNDWESLEVVGLVGDAHHEGLEIAEKPAIYRPVDQDPWDLVSLVVRSAGEPAAVADEVVAAVHEIMPTVPITDVRPMEQVLWLSVARPRVNLLALAGFALLAAVLAAIGIYGVMAYSVARRIPEIGIRMALGADRAAVRRLILARAARLATLGLALGLAAAALSARLIHALLFAVAPLDLPTFVAAGMFLAAVALGAAWIPAARGTSVDPVAALRGD